MWSAILFLVATMLFATAPLWKPTIRIGKWYLWSYYYPPEFYRYSDGGWSYSGFGKGRNFVQLRLGRCIWVVELYEGPRPGPPY